MVRIAPLGDQGARTQRTLRDGHRPWQAAALVRDGIVDIPDHHVVRNPRAREGIFLRSDPNETPADNLTR